MARKRSEPKVKPRARKDSKADIMYKGGLSNLTRDELRYVYRTFAKRADERLVRLEKMPGSDATSGAYATAARAIEHYTGPTDNPRFNRRMPKEDALLRMKIIDIKQFLDMPTSYTGVVKEVDTVRTKTMNEKYGVSFTNSQWAQIWESGLGDKLISKYGSETAFKVLANVKVRKNTFSALVKQVSNAVRDKTKSDRLDRWMKKRGLTGAIDIDNLPE